MPCVCHGAACRAAVKGQGMCAVLHKGLLDLFQGNADVLTLMSAEIQCVSVKVRGQDGNIFHYVIGMKTPLKKLMEAYCNRQSLQMDQIRFLFDGNRLRETQSPDELEMEDDDVIDAMLFQVGGK